MAFYCELSRDEARTGSFAALRMTGVGGVVRPLVRRALRQDAAATGYQTRGRDGWVYPELGYEGRGGVTD